MFLGNCKSHLLSQVGLGIDQDDLERVYESTLLGVIINHEFSRNSERNLVKLPEAFVVFSQTLSKGQIYECPLCLLILPFFFKITRVCVHSFKSRFCGSAHASTCTLINLSVHLYADDSQVYLLIRGNFLWDFASSQQNNLGTTSRLLSCSVLRSL